MITILKVIEILFKLCTIVLPIIICYLEWRKYKIEKLKGEITGPKKRIIITVIILALVVAIFNVGQIGVGKKISELTKRIPPQFDVYLAKTDKGNQVIVFDALNYVPFEAIWTLVTEENKVVNGLMLSSEKIFFNKNKKRVYYKVDPNKEGIKNNYLELRVRYKSIYYDELNKLSALSGQITKKYKYIDGEFHPIDNDEIDQ